MLSRNDSTFDYSLHSQSLITSNFHQQIFKHIYGANLRSLKYIYKLRKISSQTVFQY